MSEPQCLSDVGVAHQNDTEITETSFIGSSFSISPVFAEVVMLRQKLEIKELELTELTKRHQQLLSDREAMESQVETMKEKIQEADNKLSTVKAQSEAALRENETNQQELLMHRRRSLVGGGGGQIITQMYENIKSKYDSLKKSHEELQQKISEEVDKRNKLQKQLNFSKMLDHGHDRESLLRQLQVMKEKVDSLKRDLSHVHEDRLMIKREYSLVMSERDAVHTEMDKLLEDLSQTQEENKKLEGEKRQLVEEKEKLKNQIETLQKGSAASLDVLVVKQELYAAQRERKQALTERDAKIHEAYNAQKAHALARETIEKISHERDILRSNVEHAKQQLNEALEESKAANKWRELAFSERDKLCRELDESRRICAKMAEEREKLVKQLEEAVKEHDNMKEAKNKVFEKLHELQAKADLNQLVINENTHSHDSAIDSGDWENESNEKILKQRRTVRTVYHQHGSVIVEQGLYVKVSNCRGIAIGDRVVAVNERSVVSRTSEEINKSLSQSNGCSLQLIRYLPAYQQESNASSREEMAQSMPPSSYVVTSPEQRRLDDHRNGENKRVVLRKKTRHNNYNNCTPDGIHSEAGRQKRIGNPDSTLLTSEEESQLSGFTVYSDPSPSQAVLKKESPSHNAETLSNPFSSEKKKRPKIGSSRFWNRKKKSKSIIGTPSSGADTGGTWPRLDSPSLNNLLSGGRLSVFNKKKTRPSISPNTFTPPDGHSPGRTPPTPLRSPVSTSPLSPSSPLTPFSHSSQGGAAVYSTLTTSKAAVTVTPIRSTTRHPQHATKKRKRPVSAPIGGGSLSMWQHPVLVDNPVSSSAHTATQTETERSYKQTSPSLSNGPSYTLSTVTTDQYSQQPAVVVTPLVCQSPPLSNRSHVPYKRQQSVPESNKKLSLAPACFGSSLNSPSMSSTTSRPRSAYSLPRPTATGRGPTHSVSSHGSHDRKTKTLGDYKRIRIPSEASVGVKWSGSGSITLSSERNTPILFHPASSTDTAASAGRTGSRTRSRTDTSVSSLSVASSTLSSRSRKPPVATEPRYVTMMKGNDPIGISIVSGEHGGIFVSRLTEDSLASKGGLEYGDQLLEYNGVNLRSAKAEQARVIMSQTQPGDIIKFLVQYNPEKYRQSVESNLSDTLAISQPRPHNGSVVAYEDKDERTLTPDATPRASPHLEDALRSKKLSEPRFVFINGSCSHIKLIGGNSQGIYVAAVQSNDETLTHKPCELKIGDKILEHNGIRFSNITLEAASLRLAQSSTGSSFYVKYEPGKFKQIYGNPGDHFYVRALFDHVVDREGLLLFNRNSILLVENTFPDYVSGQWIASMVDVQGLRSMRGRIPSKVVVERDRDNSSQHQDDVSSYAGSTSGKRLSGSGRRSFFKRKKPHRTSSRSSGDVRLHKSPSENSIESTVDGVSDPLGAYQVVEKHSSDIRRPVVVFGPHSSLVVEKLAREHTPQFVKCCLTAMKGTGHDMNIIETYNHGSAPQVLTAELLRETTEEFPSRHVLLEISVEAIDRLHSIKVYPIIAFIKYPSAKKIKESQDKIVGREKISTKQCKEILERQLSIERTLMSKYYGTLSIPGGSASIVATKVAKLVSVEHSKVLWLPAKSSLLSY